MTLQLLFVILAALAASAGGVLAWVALTRRRSSRGADEVPPLLFGANDEEQELLLRPPPARPGWVPGPVAEPQPEVLSLPLGLGVRNVAERAAGVDRGERAPSARPASQWAWADAPAEEQAVAPLEAAGQAGPVEPVRPAVETGQQGDATVRLLPGRLHIVSGAGVGEEIRFVQVPGRDLAVTLGRGGGPPDTHVQLRSPTVSRMHARMRFAEGRWYVSNLSGTNPVVLNGVQLPLNGAERLLREGDRLELGDIVMRFRAR